MAAVLFTCRKCDFFYTDGSDMFCPRCGSDQIESDWVERRDFEHPEMEGFYERRDDDEPDETA
jgi:hypothetical protein